MKMTPDQRSATADELNTAWQTRVAYADTVTTTPQKVRDMHSYAKAMIPSEQLILAIRAHDRGLGQPLDGADLQAALQSGGRVSGWVMEDGTRLRIWSTPSTVRTRAGAGGTVYGIVDPNESTAMPTIADAVSAMSNGSNPDHRAVAEAYLRAVKPGVMAEYDRARLATGPKGALVKALVGAGADWNTPEPFNMPRYKAAEPQIGLQPDGNEARWRERVAYARSQGIEEGMRQAAERQQAAAAIGSR